MKRIFYDSFQKLKNATMKHPSEKILYIAYKDDNAMGRIRALSVYNETIGEQVRTKEVALEELLGRSIDDLMKASR